MRALFFRRPERPILLLKAKSRGDSQTPDMFGEHVEQHTRKDGVVQKYHVGSDKQKPAAAEPPSRRMLRELHEGTHENPFDDRERVTQRAGYELSHAGDDRVHVHAIRSFEKGKGHGSEALRHLTGLADKHGVTLEGAAVPFGQGGLKKKALSDWYRRNGFTIKHEEMERKPGAISTAKTPAPASAEADDEHPAPIPRRSIAGLSDADRAKWIALHRAQHETHYHEQSKVREEMDRVRSKRNKSETAMREAEAGLASQRKAPIAEPAREREFEAVVGKHRGEFDKHAMKLDELAGHHETLSKLRDRLGNEKDAILPGSGDLRMNLMSGQRSTLREEQDAQKDYGNQYREHFKRRATAERKRQS